MPHPQVSLSICAPPSVSVSHRVDSTRHTLGSPLKPKNQDAEVPELAWVLQAMFPTGIWHPWGTPCAPLWPPPPQPLSLLQYPEPTFAVSQGHGEVHRSVAGVGLCGEVSTPGCDKGQALRVSGAHGRVWGLKAGVTSLPTPRRTTGLPAVH